MYIASSYEGLEIVPTQTANAGLWIQGQWALERKYLCSPHFLFTFSLCYRSTEKPQLLQKEKLPVSFWKFNAELLLRTQGAAVVTGLWDMMGEKKKYFLAERNKLKQIETQPCCLTWILLHVKQGIDVTYSWKQRALQMKLTSVFYSYPFIDVFNVLMNACYASIQYKTPLTCTRALPADMKTDIGINNWRCILQPSKE